MPEVRTIVGRFIHSTWTNLNIRCSNGKYSHLQTPNKCLSYSDTLILFSREEFKDFCTNNKGTIESLSRPSLDRIDNKQHYSLDNIQIIELVDNIRKEKVKAVDSKCECFVCKDIKSVELFAKDKRRVSGRTTICKSCDSSRKKQRRLNCERM